MTKLYTDTSANLPLALLREYDIAVIPFSYTVNGVAEDYNEETDFDGKAFYDAMRRGAEVKTSMVNPATAAAFFERALAQGDDVLYVGMSGGISGTAHAAALAAEEITAGDAQAPVYARRLRLSLAPPGGDSAAVTDALLRATPGEGFCDDPLRVLRGAQFAARFRLSPDAKTLEKMRMMKTDALSPARVLGEMKKAMASDAPDVFFDVLRRADALRPWFGELAALIGVPQPPRYHPEGDAYTHSMRVLHAAAQKKARALRPEAFVFAALTHDLGKAVSTARGEDGEWHACGHENTGVPLTRAMLGRLGVNREIIAYCENMCRLHMRAHVCHYRQAETGETNLLFDESVCPNDLALLAVCDTMGKGSASGGAAGEEAFLTGRVRVYEETAARGLPDGSMLLAAGMKPGPQLAEALAAARRRALTGETAEEAVQNVLRKRQ